MWSTLHAMLTLTVVFVFGLCACVQTRWILFLLFRLLFHQCVVQYFVRIISHISLNSLKNRKLSCAAAANIIIISVLYMSSFLGCREFCTCICWNMYGKERGNRRLCVFCVRSAATWARILESLIVPLWHQFV